MSKPHIILSLDLASNFGWARVKAGVVVESGVVELPKGPDVHPGRRFLAFHNWLAKHHRTHGIKEIFYEDVPRYESKHSARVYCGLLSALQMFTLVNSISLTNIKSNSVKKEFTGNGNADKKLMCAVCHKLGWKNGHPGTDIDHDEADAIACAWVVLMRRRVEPCFIYQQSAVTA